MTVAASRTGPESRRSVLVVACGALARELSELRRSPAWSHLTIHCLPAELHNRPERIAPSVAAVLDERAPAFDAAFVAYAGCGTRGELDAVLAARGVERLPGAHCYEVFAGAGVFRELAESEPGTFFLTDFLTRQFERLVWRGLGLDRHPELRDEYFGHYRRLVYLAQSDDAQLSAAARRHAARLGLEYERRWTGLAPLSAALVEGMAAWRG